MLSLGQGLGYPAWAVRRITGDRVGAAPGRVPPTPGQIPVRPTPRRLADFDPCGSATKFVYNPNLPRRNPSSPIGNLRCAREPAQEVRMPVAPGSRGGPEGDTCAPGITAGSRGRGVVGSGLLCSGRGRERPAGARGLAVRWRQGQLRLRPRLPAAYALL